MAITSFLDITLNLENGEYGPFRKENDTPVFISSTSNHPPSILKQIKPSVEKRLSSISCNEKVFNQNKEMYETALKIAGHPSNLKYNPLPPKKKRRRIKPIYFNPPYSINVKTNVGQEFLKLLDIHFPKGSELHKYFNRSKVKISYCTMNNMKKFHT